jgi:hypothetical protein
MTPKRKKEIKHKLGCADVWDESKVELHTMLLESIIYIEKLESELEEQKREC